MRYFPLATVISSAAESGVSFQAQPPISGQAPRLPRWGWPAPRQLADEPGVRLQGLLVGAAAGLGAVGGDQEQTGRGDGDESRLAIMGRASFGGVLGLEITGHSGRRREVDAGRLGPREVTRPVATSPRRS